MARTIDNLGVDISTRYAEDREGYDESFIKEALSIPSQTKISVTLPTSLSEFDTLFQLGATGALWASFYAPPNYYAYRRRLFAEQIIPELGTPDMQEATLERVKAIGETEEAEKEKQILIKLFNNLHVFDQLLIDINSRRSQYQKG